MKLDKFVFGTYEIELHSNIMIETLISTYYQAGGRYIDTSICYNNDWALRQSLGELPELKVISKIPPQMTSEYNFFMKWHLKNLGRDKIDIMLIHNPRADWKELAYKLSQDSRIKEFGVSNFDVNDLEKFKKEFGYYPKYNEIEINPLYHNESLISFCKEHSIKIIAYAIFGGKYNALKTISDFTLPQLLNQIKLKSDLAILRVNSPDELGDAYKCCEFIPNNFESYKSGYKTIQPMRYIPRDLNLLVFNDKTSMFTYSKTKGVPKHINLLEAQMKASIKFTLETIYLEELVSDAPPLEFITDYRVWLRYNLQAYLEDAKIHYVMYYIDNDILKIETIEKVILINVYLITKDGKASKINNPEQRTVIRCDVKLQ